MVRQGQIGEIISAKPQQRRRILEEAAGIAGLHSRRHEAELRLKAAEDNLNRLEDVMKQLDSQVDSLRRQARQASRYKDLASDIRKNEALVLHISHRDIVRSLAEAERTLQEPTSAPSRIARRTRRRPRACRRSPPTNCRRCATRKPRPAPACSASFWRASSLKARNSAPSSARPNSSAVWRSSTAIWRARRR